MRKIATFLAAVTVAVMLVAGSSAVSPSSAQAAVCKWGMPTVAKIIQRNNHTVYLTYTRRGWKAQAHSRGDQTAVAYEVAFTSFTPRLVKFIITWDNDAAGIYTGTIDRDGFITGTTRDRFDSISKTSWRMSGRARCG